MIFATRIPPPLYALATGAGIWALDRCLPGLPPMRTPWDKLGWLLVAIGISLDAWAIGLFLSTRTTVNPMRPERTSRLVVSGVYRFSRNPMYLGLVFSLCGWTLLVGSPLWLPLVGLFMRVLDVVQIGPEEKALRARFGEAYLSYTREVGRWLGRRAARE